GCQEGANHFPYPTLDHRANTPFKLAVAAPEFPSWKNLLVAFSPGRSRGRLDASRGKLGQALQLLRKTKKRPRQSARPAAKRRVTLQRARSAIMAVAHAEKAF